MAEARTYLLGFYQGIGDFLSAVPVFKRLLRDGHSLIIVTSHQNIDLSGAVDLSTDKVRFVEFSLFSARSPLGWLRLVRQLKGLPVDRAFVSPHAQEAVSSWKIPVLLWLLRRLFWRRAEVVGAQQERLSRLFDRRVPIDKSLDLVRRERSLHVASGTIDPRDEMDLDIFRPGLAQRTSGEACDLIVHPGASREVKRWPVESYVELVERLGPNHTIGFMGLESELAPLRPLLAGRPNVRFLIGSIMDAVSHLARCRAAMTMDSGFSHIAAFLKIPHVAIFGSTDSRATPPLSEKSTVLYVKRLPCQPCDRHECELGTIACMRLVTSSMVAVKLTEMLSGESVESTP